MPATSSAAGKVSRLNCGLWRERGTVRTSTSRVTEWAASKAINSARVRVEWPTVNTTGWESCFIIVPANSGSTHGQRFDSCAQFRYESVSYTHLRAHETDSYL